MTSTAWIIIGAAAGLLIFALGWSWGAAWQQRQDLRRMPRFSERYDDEDPDERRTTWFGG